MKLNLTALRTGHLYLPTEYSWYLFLLEAELSQGHSSTGRIMLMKHSNDTIGNRTRDLPTCSAVPQPIAPPRAPQNLPLAFRNSDLLSTFPTLPLSTVIKYFWLYGFPPSMEKLKRKSVLSDHVSLLCSFLFIYHSRECIAAGVLLSEYCTVGRKRPGDVTWFVNYGNALFSMRCHYLLENRRNMWHFTSIFIGIILWSLNTDVDISFNVYTKHKRKGLNWYSKIETGSVEQIWEGFKEEENKMNSVVE
jgi:hypothetical protein